ncbi:MAG: sigma-54-dependent Fis family transcriptional regulator, partial [Candidatus Zixiibacteriota bacterium]
MAKILVIDDEENIRTSLKSAFDKRGHTTVTADGAARGREFASAGFDLILLDVLLPDGNGIDLLKQFLKDDPNRPVVMISGHADIETAVKAIRLGAYDFIEKPLSLDHILVTIDNATRTGQLVQQNQRLREIVYGELVGESAQIRQLRNEIVRAAPKTDRFLVLGENGTGKELVAHLIHSHSRNADGPFVPVNCAALPRELVESELFGHKAGAFTGATRNRKGRFQEADGGTLFLDEISEMPLDAQAKILRVLEDHKVTAVGSDTEQQVDIVVIAASNRNL